MTKNGRVEGNLAESLEHALALNRGSVSILTDSLASGQGVRSLLRESGRSLADGVGLLVVGTGVAFTTLTDTGVALRHLHDWNRYDWNELAQFAKFKHGDWIHKHLGAGYFKWRDSQYQSDIDRREETNKRYQFVLDQLSKTHKLSRFVIGGGCVSQFQSCTFIEDCDLLTSDRIGFDPGFLPLIGLAS